MVFDPLNEIVDEDYLVYKKYIFSIQRVRDCDLDTNETNGIKIVGGNILTQVCDNCRNSKHQLCKDSYKPFFDPYLQAGSWNNWLFAKKVRAYYKAEKVGFNIAQEDNIKHFLDSCSEYINTKSTTKNYSDCPYIKFWKQLTQ